MNFYTDLFTHETWVAFQSHEYTVSGFRKWQNIAERSKARRYSSLLSGAIVKNKRNLLSTIDHLAIAVEYDVSLSMVGL